jgi:hypothetical protein
MTTVDTAPVLRTTSAPTNNAFAFEILGDPGRRYLIYSSTDLRGWLPEWSFPGPYGYAVIGWTGADRFALQQTAPLKLLRASTYHATNEVCNNHLKEFRFASYLYGYEHHLPVSATIVFPDIMPYFKLPDFNGLPPCPMGGLYSPGATWTVPSTCNIPWHVLVEP